MLFNRLVLVLVFVSCCFPIFCHGQKMCDAFSKLLNLDTVVSRGQLDNGFTYYIRRNNFPVGKVAFFLTVKAGFLQEDANQIGLAHLMEHMGMKSTVHFSSVWAFLESLGVRPGLDANAGTGYRETFYWFSISSDSMDVKRSLFLLSEIAHRIKLDKEGIDSEKGVVINEMSAGEGYQRRLYAQYFPLLIRHSEYAGRYRDPSQEINNLNEFDHNSLIRFYEQWYCAGMQSISIVGDIDVGITKSWVEQFFKGLPACRRIDKVDDSVALKGDNLFRVIGDPEIPNVEVRVFLKHPKRPLLTEDDYRIHLLKDLVKDILKYRVDKANDGIEKTFYKIKNTWLEDGLLNIEALSFDVECKADKIESGFKAVITEIERINRYGVSDTEFNRSKDRLKRRLETSMDTSSIGIASRYKSHFLDMAASGNVLAEFNLNMCLLRQIRRDDLNVLIKLWTADINRDLFVLAPDSIKANIPDEQMFLKWWQDVKKSKILVVEPDASADQLIKPKEIKKNIKVKYVRTVLDSGIVKYELGNDVNLIFKSLGSPRSSTDKIRMNVFRQDGAEGLGVVRSFLARGAIEVVSNSGLGEMSPNQLNTFLREKNVSVTPYINSDVLGFNGVCTNSSLELMLQVFYKYFSDPVKNRTAFLTWEETRSLAARGKKMDILQVFRDSIDVITGLREQCNYCDTARPRLDDLYLAYRSVFHNISGFTFVFCGKFDVDAIFPMVLRYINMLSVKHNSEIGIALSSVKKQANRNICRNIYIDENTDRCYVELQIDLNPQCVMSLENGSKIDIFASALEHKLTERLRVKEGGTYFVSVSPRYVRYPFQRYQVKINFECLPKDLKRLQEAAIDEIRSKLTLSRDEFVRLVASQHKVVDNRINDAGFWISYLPKQLKSGRTFMEIYDQLLFFKQLKFEDFQHSVSQYTENASINNFALLSKEYEAQNKSICAVEFGGE